MDGRLRIAGVYQFQPVARRHQRVLRKHPDPQVVPVVGSEDMLCGAFDYGEGEVNVGMVDVGMKAAVAAMSAGLAVVRILAVGVCYERAGQQHLAQARRPGQHQRVRQLAAVHGHAETAFGLLLTLDVTESHCFHSLYYIVSLQ